MPYSTTLSIKKIPNTAVKDRVGGGGGVEGMYDRVKDSMVFFRLPEIIRKKSFYVWQRFNNIGG